MERSTPGLQGRLGHAVWVLPPAAFAAALVVGWPALPAGPGPVHALLLTVCAGGALIAWRHENHAAQAVALAAVAVLFAMPLNGAWTTGISPGTFIGGLLPASDAGGYTHDARRLLAGLPMSSFSSRRPLFSGLLATLLWLSGGSLQAALALLVLGAACSAWVLGRAIGQSQGPLAAVATVALLLAYYRRFAPTLQTEQLGLPLGALAFAWLWRAAHLGCIRRASAGVGVLALALNARAGAFFVLPALVAWVASVAAPGWRARARAAGLAALAVGLAFAANFSVMRFAGSSNLPFGNYSLTLYGLAAGGAGWRQAELDHPELAAVGDEERNRRALALALERIRQRPGDLIRGCTRAVVELASLGRTGLACFLPGGRGGLVVRVVFLLAVLAGLVRAWQQRQLPWARLLLLATGGFFASVPLVPPGDADEMRAYAATFPALATLAAVGVAFAVSRVGARLRFLERLSRAVSAVSSPAERLVLAPALTLAYTALAVFAPLLLVATGSPPRCSASPCPAPQVSACLEGLPGSAVEIVADDSAPRSLPGRVRHEDFQRGLAFLPDRSLAVELGKLEPGTTLLDGRDLEHPEIAFIVLPTALRPPVGETRRVCGSLHVTPARPTYTLLVVPPAAR